MRGRFTNDAPRQAEAMLEVVERLHPGALTALQQDPLGALASWPEIQVRLVTESRDGGRCSVAGSYRGDTEPPMLLVGESRSIRRRGFTGLHELGHHLQQTDLELGQRLFAHPDSERFEDEACDAFAARVLFPDVPSVDGTARRGPTAPEVVEMFKRSQASREACCVRAAEQLAGAGAVILFDADGTVLFAAPRGFIPPARGTDQSTTPLISAALRTRATVQRDRTFVTYRTGNTSDQLYGQAAWCDDEYLIAVLGVDNVGWRGISAPRPGTATLQRSSWWTCETCGEVFRVVEAPCGSCNEPRCGAGHCGCTTARTSHERVCRKCFLSLAPTRFDGASPTCRDCS
jgi:hypothetical protein